MKYQKKICIILALELESDTKLMAKLKSHPE